METLIFEMDRPAIDRSAMRRRERAACRRCGVIGTVEVVQGVRTCRTDRRNQNGMEGCGFRWKLGDHNPFTCDSDALHPCGACDAYREAERASAAEVR